MMNKRYRHMQNKKLVFKFRSVRIVNEHTNGNGIGGGGLDDISKVLATLATW